MWYEICPSRRTVSQNKFHLNAYLAVFETFSLVAPHQRPVRCEYRAFSSVVIWGVFQIQVPGRLEGNMSLGDI